MIVDWSLPSLIKMSDFKFIQFEGPNDTSNPQKRRSVRSHVMKKFHRQRRAQSRLQLKGMYGAGLEDRTEIRVTRSEPANDWPEHQMHRFSCASDEETGNGMIQRDYIPSPRYSHRALAQVPYTHVLISQRTFSSRNYRSLGLNSFLDHVI